ncbi:MAG: serine/threonine protein kinase [Candidatus Obscuribacterales bacterium]|nr:serine/threonine protein kinase [Candidatus Obscuribacterales bacterium]
MSRSTNNDQDDDRCPRCLLPRLPGGLAGDETSYLFSSLHCLCESRELFDGALSSEPIEPARSKHRATAARCQRCGRAVADSDRIGSLTGYLFQSFRCQCARPLLERQSNAKPKHAGLLTTHRQPSNNAKAGQVKKTKLERSLLQKTRHPGLASNLQEIATLSAGDIVGGSYRLLDKVGEGGMGLVYKAVHETLNRPCAVKVLAPAAVSDTNWALFKQEARILNTLLHPSICKIYDLGLHKDKLPFYAMEYLPGMTLEQVLARRNTLSLGAAMQIFKEIAGALAYAHRQRIIHKDVKPANIMLLPDKTGQVSVKLLDFGISELAETNERKSPQDNGFILGSAYYMSPEQVSGEKLTASTDIYSLGCSLFETLAGEPPYDGEGFEEIAQAHINNDVPTLHQTTGTEFPLEVEAILQKSLAKAPEQRYRNVSEMAIDMERILEGKPLQFAEVSNLELVDSFGFSRTTRIVFGTFCCLIATAIVWAFYILPQAQKKASHNMSGEKASALAKRMGFPEPGLRDDSGVVSESTGEKYLALASSKDEQAAETPGNGHKRIGRGSSTNQQMIALTLENTRREANNLQRQGRYVEMERLLSAMIENPVIKDTFLIDIIEKRAAARIAQSKWADAVKDYDRVIEQGHDEVSTYDQRAFCLFKLQKYKLAARDWRRVVLLSATQTDAIRDLATCYDKLGQTQLANSTRVLIGKYSKVFKESVLSHMMINDPKTRPEIFQKSWLCRYSQLYDSCIIMLERCLSMPISSRKQNQDLYSPGKAQIAYDLAEGYFVWGEFEQSIYVLQTLLKNDLDTAEELDIKEQSLQLLAQNHASLKQIPRALAAIDQGIAMHGLLEQNLVIFRQRLKSNKYGK